MCIVICTLLLSRPARGAWVEILLFYGNVTIPFMDRFPRGEIYDLLTTRPEDLKDGAAG